MTNPTTLDKALDIIDKQMEVICALERDNEKMRVGLEMEAGAEKRWAQERENVPGYHKPYRGAEYWEWMDAGQGFDLT